MTCTLTHAEHMTAWQSWRDDCTDLDGCGFAVRDEDQCDRGHPDDGITWCGACGHFDPVGHAAMERAALERRTTEGARAQAAGAAGARTAVAAYPGNPTTTEAPTGDLSDG